MAIEKNERLPLSSFRVYNEREARGAHADGLLRSLRAEGAAALGVAIANLPGSLHALELAGCGVTAKGVGVICDALQRHRTRFFTLPELHTLSINHDGVEAERSVVSSLSSVLQRASGLKCLTVRAAREGSSLWFRSEPSLLARLLEELQAARPPLEELTIEGYEIAPTDGLATLQLMRLGEHFGQLRALALENCSLSADALCAALAVLVRDGGRAPLRLNVSRNQLGPLGGLKLATYYAAPPSSLGSTRQRTR